MPNIKKILFQKHRFNYKILITLSVIVIITIIFVIIMINYFINIDHIQINNSQISLTNKTEDDAKPDNLLIKNYDDFTQFENKYEINSKIEKQLFDEKNILVYFEILNGCNPTGGDPTSLLINENNIIELYINPGKLGGVCRGHQYYAYMIPIDKNKLSIILPIISYENK